MFDAIVLVNDDSIAKAIDHLALETGHVSVLKTAYRDPSHYELVRMLNTYQPDLVFLEIDDEGAAIARAETLTGHDPGLVIIGFGGPWVRRLAPHLADSGVAAIMPLPLTMEGFQASVEQAVHRVHSWQMETLVSFLPAKAGCGATTAALNVAGAAASLGRKVLLIEADLHSGPIGELIRAKPRVSMREVLVNSSHMDSSSWRSSVVQFKGIDLLLTNRAVKQPVPTWIQYFHLIQFVRPLYDLVIVDLPEVINDATAEAVRRSRVVHVVTTPEVPPVALARQRMTELEGRRVAQERMRLVINRWHRTDVAAGELSEELNVPLAAVLRNDYPAVRRAMLGGQLIDAGSRLGQTYTEFACSLTGMEPPKTGGLLQLLKVRA